jgi:subtilisin family serine protease
VTFTGIDRRLSAQARNGVLLYRAAILFLLLAIILSSSIFPVQAASENSLSASSPLVDGDPFAKLGLRLRAELASQPAVQPLSIVVRLSIHLDPQQAALDGQGATVQERVIRSLQAQAALSQKDLLQFLNQPRFNGQVARLNPFWLVNAISLQASPEVIQALAARSEVAQVDLEQSYPAPVVTQSALAAWDNRGKINAPQLWAMGFRGQGVVVATLDTGADYTHPELQPGWRGGTNSWYDPYGKHATPVDLPSTCGSSGGHGTETLGVLVGKTVGVAPDAQWIAAKIFDDDCLATNTAILNSLQWLLNPDGDPKTPDAPQVINNSWGGMGCDLLFQDALIASRAAGILPVFSAGNYGPDASSGAYPGNYAEAFPVGATDETDTIASFSSRGPGVCGTRTTFPELVAPGVNIRTAYPGNQFVTVSGTSFSAPHVSGALALLLSAFPKKPTLQQQENALVKSGVDLGDPGPDDSYGYGRLDALVAYQWLLSSAQLGFSTSSQTVDQNSGVVSILINRTGGLSFPVSVDCNITGGTAVPGLDYIPPVITRIYFAAGETQKAFQVELIWNDPPAPDKTLILALSNAQVTSGIQTASLDPAASQMILTIANPLKPVVNPDPWVIHLPMIVS